MDDGPTRRRGRLFFLWGFILIPTLSACSKEKLTVVIVSPMEREKRLDDDVVNCLGKPSGIARRHIITLKIDSRDQKVVPFSFAR